MRPSPKMLQETEMVSVAPSHSSTSRKDKMALNTVALARHTIAPLAGGTSAKEVYAQEMEMTLHIP